MQVYSDKDNSFSDLLFVNFRFLYVRNASGLIRDNAKLLHMIIMIFIVTYHLDRVGIWAAVQLWKGLNYELLHIGKFCMMTNLTQTWHGEMDEDFLQRSKSQSLKVLVSQILFCIVLTIVCLVALRARYPNCQSHARKLSNLRDDPEIGFGMGWPTTTPKM